MPRVDEWFDEFLKGHTARNPADWAALKDPDVFFAGWKTNLIRAGADRDVAEEASVRLMADSPGFAVDHLAGLLVHVKAIFRERAESGRAVPTDPRIAAEAASKDCPDCDGNGLTMRWRRKSAAGRKCESITLYCRCQYGRWMKEQHRKQSPDVYARIYDLVDYSFLWGDEFRQPMTAAEREQQFVKQQVFGAF